jgi:hypothetical protein
VLFRSIVILITLILGIIKSAIIIIILVTEFSLRY